VVAARYQEAASVGVRLEQCGFHKNGGAARAAPFVLRLSPSRQGFARPQK
jgi:hypothetical protein